MTKVNCQYRKEKCHTKSIQQENETNVNYGGIKQNSQAKLYLTLVSH